MGTPAEGRAAAGARDERAAALAALRAAIDAHGPRTCKWPPCPLAAAPVAARGPHAQAGTPAPAPAGTGGHRPEFCSESHKRANARAVDDLRRLRGDAQRLKDTSPVREHKAVDAVLADLARRLALHGEPPPPADSTAHTAAGSVVPLRTVPTPPNGDARPPHGPVLELRPAADPNEFADDWEFLRDSNDAARLLLDRISRAADDQTRRRLAADHWHDLVDVARAADQVVAALARPDRSRKQRR